MESSHRALTLFSMTLRSVTRRRMRSLLTALGVSMGVVAIVAFTSLVQGARAGLEAGIKMESDLVVFQAGVSADILSVLNEKECRAALEGVPRVASAVPFLFHVLPIADRPFCLIFGMNSSDLIHGDKYLVEGRILKAPDEIVLGVLAQRMLGLKVGETLDIRGEPYRIVGVARYGVVVFDGTILMDLRRLQELSGKEGLVSAFQVRVTAGVDPSVVCRDIEARRPDMVAISSVEDYSRIDQGLQIGESLVWVVSAIAIIVGSIVVANTMWMSVLERTREIGVLRAVGWARRDIVRMIVLESTMLGLLGGAMGSLIGVGLAKFVPMLPNAGQFIAPVFSAFPFILAFVIAILLGALGAILPAWRAAHVSPAEALRYE